jgi:hypothetical protein
MSMEKHKPKLGSCVVGIVTDPSGAAVPGAKSFSLTERVKLRFDTQFFNVFNHPNFVLFADWITRRWFGR